jgi:glycosyltransferase involved in cell wall biosynthesis
MNRPFSVLVFATQHMKIGGIESHLQEFCYWLTENGVKIDLIILDAKMLPETEAFFHKVCRRFFSGNYGKSSFRLLWLFFIKIKLFNRRYDAVYTNGQGKSILPFGRLFSSGSKWVHHYHQSGDAEDQATWGKSYRRSLATADEVIACSNSIARVLAAAINRSVQIIPCFSREVSINSKRREGGKLKFGYYGRLIPEKGIDTLCELSRDKDLEHIEVHIWGQGSAYPDSFFLAYPNIHFHGPFSGEEELARVIETLDAYLLLSTNPEALPIVLLEVMSGGLPWFATDRGGIPDIFQDPHTTRIIPSFSTYEEIKIELLDFAATIQKGEVNRNSLRNIYATTFSAKVLVKSWFKILGFSTDTYK